MIGYERDTINAMRAGHRPSALVSFGTRLAIREAHGHLSNSNTGP